MIKPELQELFERAKAAREKSYSPYSHHKVGAAIRTSDGKIYGGCNVENSSYGGTICAERTAIAKAVSEQGRIEITEVFVVTDASPAWSPCGICRQVISEFGPRARIHFGNLKGEMDSMTLAELLPRAFSPRDLGK